LLDIEYSTPSVTDEDRTVAMSKTISLFKQLTEVSKELGVSPDHMPVMWRAYERFENQISDERVTKFRNEQVIASSAREPLPIRSQAGMRATKDREHIKLPSDRCPLDHVVTVTAVPQRAFYQIDQLQILGRSYPEHWRVHGITIGNQSQFAQEGAIDGRAFGPDGILRDVKFVPMSAGMELAMLVEYIGPNPEGMPFEAAAFGTSLRHR
jgi:hypothetical protein